MTNRDVIVCLGQALLPNAEPNPVLLTRCDKAVELYRILKCPIINTGGDPVGCGKTEARVMSEYMKSVYGVDKTYIIEESEAKSTLENAIFVLKILEGSKNKNEDKFCNCDINVYLVTSPHHMARSSYFFKAVFDYHNFKFNLIEAPSCSNMTSNMLKQNLMCEKNFIVHHRNRWLESKCPIIPCRGGHNIPLPEDSVLCLAIAKIDSLLDEFELHEDNDYTK